MDENLKLTRLETLMEVVGADVKDTKNEVREIRKENEAWRHAHEKATQEKLDHARRNVEQKFDAIERKLADKASLKDLDDNQEKSDERWIEVRTMIDRKADGWVQKLLSGAVALILTAVLTAIIGGVILDRKSDHPTSFANVGPAHSTVAPEKTTR